MTVKYKGTYNFFEVDFNDKKYLVQEVPDDIVNPAVNYDIIVTDINGNTIPDEEFNTFFREWTKE